MPIKSLGEKLKELRKTKNISLEKLGKEVDITASTLGDYENDNKNPTVDRLKRLAIFYDVSLDYLAGLSDAKPIDISIQAICKKTGLSDNAVKVLCDTNDKDITIFLSQLITYPCLCLIAHKYSEYIEIVKNPDNYFSCEEAYIKAIGEIENPVVFGPAGRDEAEKYTLFKCLDALNEFIQDTVYGERGAAQDGND